MAHEGTLNNTEQKKKGKLKGRKLFRDSIS